jgi:hypothetical protein
VHRDLEAVLAADEESRARVDLAAKAAEQRELTARAAAAAEKSRLLADAEAAVASEVGAICGEGDARIEELTRARSGELHALASIGEEQFENAVRAFIDIVCTPEAKR